MGVVCQYSQHQSKSCDTLWLLVRIGLFEALTLASHWPRLRLRSGALRRLVELSACALAAPFWLLLVVIGFSIAVVSLAAMEMKREAGSICLSDKFIPALPPQRYARRSVEFTTGYGLTPRFREGDRLRLDASADSRVRRPANGANYGYVLRRAAGVVIESVSQSGIEHIPVPSCPFCLLAVGVY